MKKRWEVWCDRRNAGGSVRRSMTTQYRTQFYAQRMANRMNKANARNAERYGYPQSRYFVVRLGG